LDPAHGPSERGHIALAIRAARKAQGFTFEQVASQAGLSDADMVRDIEYGSDAKMSDVAAIANALGLRLELVLDGS
jgi:transcriptional regulator with XRE-family HTH domain